MNFKLYTFTKHRYKTFWHYIQATSKNSHPTSSEQNHWSFTWQRVILRLNSLTFHKFGSREIYITTVIFLNLNFTHFLRVNVSFNSIRSQWFMRYLHNPMDFAGEFTNKTICVSALKLFMLFKARIQISRML